MCELKYKHWEANCFERFWGRKQKKRLCLNGRKHRHHEIKGRQTGGYLQGRHTDTLCLPLGTKSVPLHLGNVFINAKQSGN